MWAFAGLIGCDGYSNGRSRFLSLFPTQSTILHCPSAPGLKSSSCSTPKRGKSRTKPPPGVVVCGDFLERGNSLERERELLRRIPPTLRFTWPLPGIKMVVQSFTVDLTKPLVFQVGHLGESYQEWVHQPIVSKEGPRFFKSDFWEFLTLTPWWAIPVIWLPVVCWLISLSVRMGHTSKNISMMVLFGIFVWTLLEYTLHRFLFHIKTKSYWGNTMHYLIHGCHHKHPMDGMRLVFPPAATAVLLVPFWSLVKLMSTPSTTPGLLGGGLLGYVMYDVTHYYLHHAQPSSEIPRNLKKYHLNHHFRIQNKGFGITSSVWDRVFGTLPSTKAAERSR